jgi:hypothetical protein
LQYAKGVIAGLKGKVRSLDQALVENAKNYDTEIAHLRAKIAALTDKLAIRTSGATTVRTEGGSTQQWQAPKTFGWAAGTASYGRGPFTGEESKTTWPKAGVLGNWPGNYDEDVLRGDAAVQNIIDTCNTAAKTGQRLRMEYRNQEGVTTWRTIVPQSVRSDGKGGRTLIYAYDFLRDAKRSFRADRVLALYVDPSPLKRRADTDV